MTPAQLLHAWLKRQLPAIANDWLEQKRVQLATHTIEKELYLAISLVPRKLGKADLALNDTDLVQAEQARPGWNPNGWSVDQASRILLLLSTQGSAEQFAERLEQLCNTADVGELITFYRGLPLYPKQEQYVARAAEGIRSNMKAVFEAVAHRNPYPAEQLPESAWNQMILKAIFVGSTLHHINGLDARSNPGLMRMLCDFAHERWAAKRPVSPELWRCVGPYADDAALEDLQHVLNSGGEQERRAAALALNNCPDTRAAAMLETVPELTDAISHGEITWKAVSPA